MMTGPIINMYKPIIFALICAAVLQVSTGCSNRHKVTTVVERHSSPTDPYGDVEMSTNYEKSTTTDTSQRNESVLGATFDVIGDIISWPFRVVGALLKAIF